MFIDIIPLQKNTARLTRVYGDAPCAALPASVPGPEGGVLAITELGDYCFSEKPRSLPGADALCRYEGSPDGTCTLVQAFGRDLTGRHGRYDLDFGEGSAAPEELHPVCGNFVEEIILPDSLQVIGSCAFYNCRSLRLLTVGSGSLTVGSDVFLNCFALETIRVQAEAERLLLYSSKSSKEIALMLGFEDQATFSRFFKNATGLSTTEYRKKNKIIKE